MILHPSPLCQPRQSSSRNVILPTSMPAHSGRLNMEDIPHFVNFSVCAHEGSAELKSKAIEFHDTGMGGRSFEHPPAMRKLGALGPLQAGVLAGHVAWAAHRQEHHKGSAASLAPAFVTGSGAIMGPGALAGCNINRGRVRSANCLDDSLSTGRENWDAASVQRKRWFTHVCELVKGWTALAREGSPQSRRALRALVAAGGSMLRNANTGVQFWLREEAKIFRYPKAFSKQRKRAPPTGTRTAGATTTKATGTRAAGARTTTTTAGAPTPASSGSGPKVPSEPRAALGST